MNQIHIVKINNNKEPMRMIIVNGRRIMEGGGGEGPLKRLKGHVLVPLAVRSLRTLKQFVVM